MKKPKFTEEEQAQIVTDLLVLRRNRSATSSCATSCRVPARKRRSEVTSRRLQEGVISLTKLVDFLDEVIPWGKQHVFLYKGPKSSIANWKKTTWLAKLLKKHQLGKYLNATLPLALPEEMKVSSIMHDGNRLRITAVKSANGGSVTLNTTTRHRPPTATTWNFVHSFSA